MASLSSVGTVLLVGRRPIVFIAGGVAAVAVAVSVAVRAGSHVESVPGTLTVQRVMLFEAVPASSITQVDVSAVCRERLAPLRDMMNAAMYPSEVDTDDWEALAAEATLNACSPSEVFAFQSTEVREWMARVGPVYDTDVPATLTPLCAAALAPARDKLGAVDVERAAISAIVASAGTDGTLDVPPVPGSIPGQGAAPTATSRTTPPDEGAPAETAPPIRGTTPDEAPDGSPPGTDVPVPSLPASPCSPAQIEAFTQREFLPALRRAGLEARGEPTSAWAAYDAAHTPVAGPLTPGRGSTLEVEVPSDVPAGCAEAFEAGAAAVVADGYAAAYDDVVSLVGKACGEAAVADFIAEVAPTVTMPPSGAPEQPASLTTLPPPPSSPTVPAPAPPPTTP